MRLSRFVFAFLAAAALPIATAPAHADDHKIRIGMAIGGNGFHIPSYVAMAQGFYKKNGIDASWVEMNGRALINAALAGNVDTVPIPSGGAQAALRGAKMVYIVNESLRSQWTIVTPKSITKVEQLKGQTVAYGQEGGANYDEGAAVLARFFKMRPGKDYKVISFQSETGELAALINGDVKAALVSVPHAAQAIKSGYHVLLRTGDYLPRVGGSFWVTQKFFDSHPETVKAFIRSIAEAVTYFRANKEGSIPILKKYLGFKDDATAAIVWDQLHDAFGAEMPKDLFHALFESRRQTMIRSHAWSKDKPLPDPEQWLARGLLESTLKEMSYVPTRVGPKT
jgi:ABC-type nitrate/sulfonate/bicarbonate transport system substrate-binding protein